MTRDEVQAVIDEIESAAATHEEKGANEWHEADGMRRAARMLAEALEKSEAAALCDDCNHPPHEAHCCEGRDRERGLNRGCECQKDSPVQP